MSQEQTQLSTLSEQENLLIENLANGMNTRNAAIAAGYSEATANSTIYSKLRRPAFLARLGEAVKDLPDARVAIAKARLPLLARLESKAYEKMEDEPELVLKYGKFTEREYKLAGLLADAPAQQTTITVNVQSFMAQLWDKGSNEQNTRNVTVDASSHTLTGDDIGIASKGKEKRGKSPK